jgi:hypothetical protein
LRLYAFTSPTNRHSHANEFLIIVRQMEPRLICPAFEHCTSPRYNRSAISQRLKNGHWDTDNFMAVDGRKNVDVGSPITISQVRTHAAVHFHVGARNGQSMRVLSAVIAQDQMKGSMSSQVVQSL